MNIFQQSATNPKATQDSLLGPSYSYSNNIRNPTQLGMSDAGNLSTLGSDINGLLSYVDLLVDGSGSASIPGGPLGNKYFMKTGATCKNVATNKGEDRYIYVNNVPSGSMPGLIDGVVTGLEVLNPFAIMGAFTSGSEPPCMQITMETIDTNSNHGQETHYVTLADLNEMSSSSFPNGQKPTPPTSSSNTVEGFHNYHDIDNSGVNMPDDMIIQFYFACLAGVGLYLLYKIGQKRN